MTAEIGRVLGGRYRLVAPIGMGASAQVFLADDVRLRRRVAVKMLHDALAGDAEFLRRFAAEARAAAALNHPNVMAVYDWGDDEVAFIVTEYLSGGSLRALLDAGHLLTPSQALTVGLDAARALDYAHRRGFVHRDIKPANLLFGDDQRLRIADFGLARALAEAAWTEPQGAVLGTARYASPEQAKGETLTGKADVYSLAIVLIEAVTGVVPFTADTTLGTLMARVDRQLEVPEALGPLVDVLTRAGHPDPEQRIDSRTFAAGLLRAAKALPRPQPLPLAGALPPAGEVAADLDPTVHAPVAGVSGAVAVAGVAGAAVADRSGLTADDLDLVPPDWVNRADAVDVGVAGAAGAAVPVLDPEPGRETVVVDLRDAEPADQVGGQTAGTAVGEADTGEHPVAVPGHEAPDVGSASDAAEGDEDLDEDLDADRDDQSSADVADAVAHDEDAAGADAERELAVVGAAVAAEPAWADATGGTRDGADPVDRVVDPSATAVVPPVRIDDFAYDPAPTLDPHGPLGPADRAPVAGRRRRWPWAVAAVVVLAGGGGVAVATLVDRDPAPPEPALVLPLPELTNRSIDEAKALVSAGGWKLGEVTERRQDNTMKGQVLATSPDAGARLPVGGVVDLTVSIGQQIYPVPLDELADTSVAEATAILDEAGFAADTSGRAYHEDVDEGRVIGAVPGTGDQAERGGTIGLQVSRGPRPRTVPAGLVGGTEASAREALEAVQLQMAKVGTYSDDIDEGQVISVLPRSGETVPRGSVVSVEVSLGPELRRIPDVSRAGTLTEAASMLTNAGFEAAVSGSATGRPRRTNPAAGTLARPGTTVTIIMG